jgi:hypothetical protein
MLRITFKDVTVVHHSVNDFQITFQLDCICLILKRFDLLDLL